MIGWRLAAALCVVPAMLGCGGDDVYFELDVRNFVPGDGCPFPLSFTDWGLEVRQGSVEQCARGACAQPDSQPIDCVAGVETPPVSAGESVTITLGLYDRRDMPPVACAQRTINGGVEQGDQIVLEMRCGSMELLRCPPWMELETECPAQQP